MRGTVKLALLLLCAGSAICLTPVTGLADNLQQAIEQTIATHPQVLSAESEQEAANQDIKQQVGGYLPSLDATAGYGYETTDNPATRASGLGNSGGAITLFRQESNFLLEQLLFDGGNVSNRVAKAKADYQTTTFQVYGIQEALGYDAALIYLSILEDRELIRIARLNVSAHEDLYSKIGRRVQAGAGKTSDLNLAQSRLALAKSDYFQAIGQLQNDEATYVKVVGYPAPAVLEMPPQPQNIPLTLTRAQQLAIELNPNLAASKTLVASNIASVGVAKSAFFPTVTLDLNSSFNDSLAGVPGYNNSRSALIRMNYNVFRGGSDKAAVSAARYRVIAAEQDNQKLQRDTLETVAFAWNNMQTSINRVPELRVHSAQSYNVWQAYIKQFQLGQRTLFDLLNSQSEYYDSQSALITAQYQERTSRYQLLASIGELVSTVKNPIYNRENTEIVYPASTIKTIKVTLPADNTTTGGTTSNSNSWSYPADIGKSPTTPTSSLPASPVIPATPVVAPQIPSLTEPSTVRSSWQPLQNATPHENLAVPPSVPSLVEPTPLEKNPGKSAPDLYMQNDKTTNNLVASKDSYHIQLFASQSKWKLVEYGKKHHLAADELVVTSHLKQGEQWYELVYGNYSSLSSAEVALKQVEQRFHDIKPSIIKKP